MKLALATLLLTAICFGQYDGATVLGTVTDPSGSLVSKTRVVLKNVETGVFDNTESDNDGNYQFLEVRIGRYEIAAQASGFKSITTAPFMVAVGARQRVALRLEVGDV